ncbi:MAG TPA: Ig-like domain-containing protein, partial [Candidatus Glassbacteria bacterium]|nr:Ig-like domain-containing protein [Candidatus Glassbacteria bacterium]
AQAFDKVWNGPTVSDTQTFILDTLPPQVLETSIRVEGQPRSLQATPPLLKITKRDTIVVRLQDNTEAGYYSGLDLQKTTIRLLRSTGSEVPGAIAFRQPDTVRFVVADSIFTGDQYTLRITAFDSLENRADNLITFNLGAESPAPSLISASAAPVHGESGYLNSRLDAQAAWVFTVALQDNSNTGIDAANSSLKLLFLNGAREIDGSVSADAATLTFTTSEKIATDGSDDGLYLLIITANDLDPTSGAFGDTIAFYNDTQRPDTASVNVDASRVKVVLTDKGRFPSGVDISNSTVSVNAGGAPVPGEPTNDGDSTLYFTFSQPLTAGTIYTVTATIQDVAQNENTVSRLFVVGGIGLKPEVVLNPGLTAFSFRDTLNADALTQPLVASIQVTDVSEQGINWDSTWARLLRPDSTELALNSTRNGDRLTLTATELLSNSGADDGRYRLLIHVADKSSFTADLDTSFAFIFDNRAPDTSAVEFVGDTSSVKITLADRPAVAGVAVAGLDLIGASVAVSGPSGQAVAFSVTHDGKSTLTVAFEGGKPAASGVYTIAVTVLDFAGNQRSREISFTLNITGRIDFYPPDSSIVTGPLGRVVAYAVTSAGALAPGPDATLSVTRAARAVPGAFELNGDSLVYTFNDSLATD